MRCENTSRKIPVTTKTSRRTDLPHTKKNKNKFNLIRSSLRSVWHWQAVKSNQLWMEPDDWYFFFQHVKCDVNAIKWWQNCSLNCFNRLRISQWFSIYFLLLLLLREVNVDLSSINAHIRTREHNGRCFWATPMRMLSKWNGMDCVAVLLLLTLTAASYPYQF